MKAGPLAACPAAGGGVQSAAVTEVASDASANPVNRGRSRFPGNPARVRAGMTPPFRPDQTP